MLFVLDLSIGNSRVASQFQISVAQHSLKAGASQEARMVSVNRIVMHPNYLSRQVADDIALIHLKDPVEWSDYIQPACLPNPDQETFSGVLATVAGWGWTDEIKNGISLECFHVSEMGARSTPFIT